MKEISQRDYACEIADIARECTLNALEYDRDIHDVLHETIDGHQWVIYNWAHDWVLRWSDNSTALFDELGPQTAEDWSTLRMRGAYMAMYADVSQHEDLRDPEYIDRDCEACGTECNLIITDDGPQFACNDEDDGCGAMYDPLEINW